jgi:hypothetical protein
MLLNVRDPKILLEIKDDGFGSALFTELNSSQGLSLERVLEYITVEENGTELMNFIRSNLGEFKLIEHF